MRERCQVTAVSPLTEREFTYVRSVRELGTGNGPLSPFSLFEQLSYLKARGRDLEIHLPSSLSNILNQENIE